MEAKISQDGEVLVVHLRGYLNFEATDPFRKTCLEHLANKKVVFNLDDLNFVGSCGITSFVDTIRDLRDRSSENLKFCGLSSEFKKVFAANSLESVEVYDDPIRAAEAFRNPETLALDWVEEARAENEGFLATSVEEEASVEMICPLLVDLAAISN